MNCNVSLVFQHVHIAIA